MEMENINNQIIDAIENGSKEDIKKMMATGLGFAIGGAAMVVGGCLISKAIDAQGEIEEDFFEDVEDVEDEVINEPTEEEDELPMEESAEKVEEEDVEEDTTVEMDKEDSPKGQK